VVESYAAALKRLPIPFELILVVNGPRDRSIVVARELEAAHAGVRVLEIERGQWGHAVRIGLEAARGDLLCYTNSARTSSQDLTLVLLYAIAYPAVVIKVNRRIRESWTRWLGSPGLDVARAVCGVHAVDAQSGRVLGSYRWPNGNQIFACDWIARDAITDRYARPHRL
jgi:glycosyltransferase involved in cell wall biosynthesis